MYIQVWAASPEAKTPLWVT